MPYDKMSDLPDHIQKMPMKKRKVWMAAFNAAHAGYKPGKTKAKTAEAYAFAVANAAIQEGAKSQARGLAALADGVPLLSVFRAGLLPEASTRQHHCLWCGRSAAWRHGATQRTTPAGTGNGQGMREALQDALGGHGGVGTVVKAALAESIEDWPFSAIQDAISRALRDKMETEKTPWGGMPEMSCYPLEVFADRAICRMGGKLMAVPYTIDDAGDAVLGEPVPVRVEYVKVPAGSEE